MSKAEKTLGDVIQEALKKAATEGAEPERCGCMNCSGEPIFIKEYRGNLVTVQFVTGTDAFGNEEAELVVTMDKDGEPMVIKVTEGQEIAEFCAAMQEIFA